MSDISLVLGGVQLTGFELPERVGFGGAQRLAVHRLPGGTRIIDAMGRDDAELRWSGVFTGSDAGERARLLDAMRVAGLPLALSWDTFFYTVVIARLDLEYGNTFWMPYAISCTVVADPMADLTTTALTVAGSVTADLTTAGAWINAAAPLAALAVSGAATRGTAAYVAAQGALATAQASVSGGIAAAEPLLQSDDLATATSAAGSLAQLTTAQGYLGRAATNLADAST